MVQDQIIEEEPEVPPTVEPTVESTVEPSKVSLHIYMPAKEYQRIKKWAEYAAIEGLIEGHPRGNFTDYCNFCFNLGEQHLSKHMLNKRGYK